MANVYSLCKSQRSLVLATILAGVLVSVIGCGLNASYVTPGRGVELSELAQADIQELLSRKPASPFPARLSVVRVQAPDYRSYRIDGYGYGRYSVVTTRDIEEEKHFERIGRLPMITAVAPINRLLLPAKLESEKELRLAAVSLQTDLLLVYTLDTSFRTEDKSFGPLTVITLGLFGGENVYATATASAVIYDVRTGFVYGLAESTAREEKFAHPWTGRSDIEAARLQAESKAFEQLLNELDKTWKAIVTQHAKNTREKNRLGG